MKIWNATTEIKLRSVNFDAEHDSLTGFCAYGN
jgi:hypothetical protein